MNLDKDRNKCEVEEEKASSKPIKNKVDVQGEPDLTLKHASTSGATTKRGSASSKAVTSDTVAKGKTDKDSILKDASSIIQDARQPLAKEHNATTEARITEATSSIGTHAKASSKPIKRFKIRDSISKPKAHYTHLVVINSTRSVISDIS